MNEAQRIAYLMAQITACQCRYQAMVTANIQVSITRRPHEIVRLPYEEQHFNALIDEYGLGHNSVMTTLTGAF